MIKAPNAGSADPELEAQAAIEGEFLLLVDRAVAAGWMKLQAAIGDLADNNWYKGGGRRHRCGCQNRPSCHHCHEPCNGGEPAQGPPQSLDGGRSLVVSTY